MRRALVIRGGRSTLFGTGDVGLELGPAHVVGALYRRGLHQVGRGGDQGAADAAVLGDLGRTDAVDDDAGRVGGVPDLELVLEVQRHVAERATLETDVGPLAVVEPLDVVARADVDVALAQVVGHVGRDGPGLGELFGLPAVALEHVLEVHVAADVQLVGAVLYTSPSP